MKNEKMSYLIPTVIEKTPNGERAFDIYSRLLEDRFVFLGGHVDDGVANTVIAQMLFLANRDPKKSIKFYINSPGGSVSAGMAIYDTMNFVKCPVETVCIGMAASIAAFILAGGEKGRRYALPNSEILIHQVMGGIEGQASDIEIAAKHIIRTKAKLNKLLSDFTGQSLSKVEKDSDRDYWMTPEEAKEYGLIDSVVKKDK